MRKSEKIKKLELELKKISRIARMNYWELHTTMKCKNCGSSRIKIIKIDENNIDPIYPLSVKCMDCGACADRRYYPLPNEWAWKMEIPLND